MDRESLKLLLAQGLSVERIAQRFGKHPSTVAYWMKKHGLEAPRRGKHASKGGLEREQLEALVLAGLTIAEIAATLDRSKSTVRFWLGRYGLETTHRGGRQRRAAVRAAKDAGILTIRLVCPHHGETEFCLEGRGAYRCKRCRSEAVSRRRRRVKSALVAEAGGRCRICGYDRHVAALHFHHVDPGLKRMAVSAGGIAYSIDTLREEAKKCVLLCSNCHAELESGATKLPVQ